MIIPEDLKLSAEECGRVSYLARQAMTTYHFRYGQAVFNTLVTLHGSLADYIRCEELDMFYRDDKFTNEVLFTKLNKDWYDSNNQERDQP